MERADRAYAVNARRHLHKYPELSLKEYKTAEYIRRQLVEFGLEYVAVGETGTFAVIEGGKGQGRRVLLRADIDALPMEEKTGLPFKSVHEGVMHACGHDLHTAALLSAAKRLAELKDSFAGTVLLAFQQAEEKGHGASFFREQGLTSGYDRAFGVHIAPDRPLGKVVLSRGADAPSCDIFRMVLTGKKAHIARPHLGIDALQAGAVLAGELAKLSARAIDPADKVIVGVGLFRAGTSYNIIADEAVIEGTLRAYTEENRKRLQDQVRELAAGVERLYRVKAACEIVNCADVLVNDDTVREEAAEVARQLLGEGGVEISEEPAFGFAADDFSEFLRECPGAYAHVGVGAEGKPASWEPLHSDRLEPEEEAVIIAANLHLNYALQVLGAAGEGGRP